MKTFNFQIITKDFTLEESVEYLSGIAEVAAVSSADVLQLRNKNISSRDLYDCSVFLKKKLDNLNKGGKIFLIINDRPDIAYIAGADGVHVGQEDFPADKIKKFFPNLIVGVSVKNLKQAEAAQIDGADYIGVGHLYPTSSKKDAGEIMDKEIFKHICRSVDIPVIAIGGITADKIEELGEYGAAGAAVISSVSNADNPLSAAKDFRIKIDKFLKNNMPKIADRNCKT
ncbi:MAG: thiamine phosphate synthase [Candidatus Acidulodesulfobacterium sp.]